MKKLLILLTLLLAGCSTKDFYNGLNGMSSNCLSREVGCGNRPPVADYDSYNKLRDARSKGR